jgi:hypothetical protein
MAAKKKKDARLPAGDKLNGKPLIDALIERGIIPRNCRRVTIDLDAGAPAMLYYEVIGDSRLLETLRDHSVKIEYKEKQIDGNEIKEH